MKLLVVFLWVATALAAPPARPSPPQESPEPLSGYNYHERVGFALTARIKASEEAADFDGTRIVGGTNVNRLGQYPFMAGLVILTTTGRQTSCGASLVSNTRCLTAAHCWTDGVTTARQYTVVLGSLWLFQGGTRITTNQVLLHPSYQPRSLQNDIAIIAIRHVAFTTNINRINLPTGTSSYAGVSANAIGWGFTSQNSGVSQSLRHVSMPVITNNECSRLHGHQMQAAILCTSTAGGRSICFGDSGGPLHVTSGNVLIGISSFVHHTGCQGGRPAGFTRVTSHAAWVRRYL